MFGFIIWLLLAGPGFEHLKLRILNLFRISIFGFWTCGLRPLAESRAPILGAICVFESKTTSGRPDRGEAEWRELPPHNWLYLHKWCEKGGCFCKVNMRKRLGRNNLKNFSIFQFLPVGISVFD